MPYAPPRVCARCHQPVPAGKRCVCRPAWEGSTHPHDDVRMKQLRRDKLATNPICEKPGCRHPATDVDHIVPLAEGGARHDWANLQSLCHTHHRQKTTQDALRGKRRAR